MQIQLQNHKSERNVNYQLKLYAKMLLKSFFILYYTPELIMRKSIELNEKYEIVQIQNITPVISYRKTYIR